MISSDLIQFNVLAVVSQYLGLVRDTYQLLPGTYIGDLPVEEAGRAWSF